MRGGRYTSDIPSVDIFPYACLRAAHQPQCSPTNYTARENSRWLPNVYLCSRHAEELDQESGAVESPVLLRNLG
jgi:hypothetical protein